MNIQHRFEASDTLLSTVLGLDQHGSYPKGFNNINGFSAMITTCTESDLCTVWTVRSEAPECICHTMEGRDPYYEADGLTRLGLLMIQRAQAGVYWPEEPHAKTLERQAGRDHLKVLAKILLATGQYHPDGLEEQLRQAIEEHGQ